MPWIVTIETPGDHKHIDAPDPAVAATYINEVNDELGHPVASRIDEYADAWECFRCGTKREVPHEG